MIFFYHGLSLNQFSVLSIRPGRLSLLEKANLAFFHSFSLEGDTKDRQRKFFFLLLLLLLFFTSLISLFCKGWREKKESKAGDIPPIWWIGLSPKHSRRSLPRDSRCSKRITSLLTSPSPSELACHTMARHTRKDATSSRFAWTTVLYLLLVFIAPLALLGTAQAQDQPAEQEEYGTGKIDHILWRPDDWHCAAQQSLVSIWELHTRMPPPLQPLVQKFVDIKDSYTNQLKTDVLVWCKMARLKFSSMTKETESLPHMWPLPMRNDLLVTQQRINMLRTQLAQSLISSKYYGRLGMAMNLYRALLLTIRF